MAKYERINLFAPGHKACPGCGAAIAVRQILRAAGPDTCVTSATGCVETFSSAHHNSSWQVPWMHSLFENAGAVAAGIETAYRAMGKQANHIIISGDGGTFDIGCASMFGMFERGHNITYVCYDNEAYMNTGVQRSSATPLGAATTTSPVGTVQKGNRTFKKNMPEIAAAHGCAYVATACVSYPQDLMDKVAKSLAIEGPKYLQVYTPCTIGWGYASEDTVAIGRLAVETGLVPIYEWTPEDGYKVRKVAKKKPVQAFFEKQSRYQHMLEAEQQALLAEAQAYCERNIRRYDI